MAFLIHLTVPKKRAEEVSGHLRDSEYVKSFSKLEGEASFNYFFRVAASNLIDCLKELDNAKIGIDYGIVNIIPLQATKPAMQDDTPKKEIANPRLPTEVMYAQAESGSTITFDYITLLLVASVMAGVGLIMNSAVVLIASMLVSPLMGPIVGLTFGTMIRDKNLIKKALKSEVVGIIISVTVGLILGLTVAHWGPELNLPTTEMTDRGQERSIYFNIIIALLSGVGVAISMTGGMVSSLVGVAISVSLLPPIVNAGMLLMIAIVGESFVPNPPFYNPPQLYLYAARSFFLFIVNIVCVYIAGIIIFKVKAVVPIATEASSFWTDIKDILNQDPKDHPWNRKAITGVSVDDTAGDKQPPPPRYSSPEWRAQLAARLQALLPSDDYVSTIQKLHDYTSTVM